MDPVNEKKKKTNEFLNEVFLSVAIQFANVSIYVYIHTVGEISAPKYNVSRNVKFNFPGRN